mmetsp:Transcript_23394/g.69663  ORF Transcript_23394/g.69663 Transcript_23394/m.69663 type:complete len:403 (+) Transcript_23394:1407-2615(+)
MGRLRGRAPLRRRLQRLRRLPGVGGRGHLQRLRAHEDPQRAADGLRQGPDERVDVAVLEGGRELLPRGHRAASGRLRPPSGLDRHRLRAAPLGRQVREAVAGGLPHDAVLGRHGLQVGRHDLARRLAHGRPGRQHVEPAACRAEHHVPRHEQEEEAEGVPRAEEPHLQPRLGRLGAEALPGRRVRERDPGGPDDRLRLSRDLPEDHGRQAELPPRRGQRQRRGHGLGGELPLRLEVLQAGPGGLLRRVARAGLRGDRRRGALYEDHAVPARVVQLLRSGGGGRAPALERLAVARGHVAPQPAGGRQHHRAQQGPRRPLPEAGQVSARNRPGPLPGHEALGAAGPEEQRQVPGASQRRGEAPEREVLRRAPGVRRVHRCRGHLLPHRRRQHQREPLLLQLPHV